VRAAARQAGLALAAIAAGTVGMALPVLAAPLAKAKSELVPFESAPFPYDGWQPLPGQDKPFFDVEQEGRRGHTSPRGGIYWEDATYSDRRVLLFIPRGFDPARPAVMIVYLHGNLATLERDVVNRQQVPRQLAESGLNAVLVAPQLAVNALDSTAGKFYTPGAFRSFIEEAAAKLARLYGQTRARAAIVSLPVVLVAYSGGYVPAAWALHKGGTDKRVIGVLLLDALYGEVDKYAEWIGRHPKSFFISAYTSSSAHGNETLQGILANRDVDFDTSLPPRLRGTVAFLPTSGVSHESFVTRAWVDDPIRVVLERMGGYARYPNRQARVAP
jgi:hypothetical protein